MSIAKFAAALHVFADALLDDVEGEAAKVVEAVKGKGRGKAATPTSAAAAQTAAPAASAPVAPSTADVAPAVLETAPAAPAITKDQLNKVVLKVAAKNRDDAVAILTKFGLTNTVNLPEDKWQAVYDAFEEEIAKIDAAAVHVAQQSLV